MGVFSENAIIGASAQGGYEIEQSLRFEDGDSPYLTRQYVSAGNRKIYTLSCWVKRGALGDKRIFGADGSSNFAWVLQFDSNNKISVGAYSGGYVYQVVTTAVYRDVGAWYHIVVATDTTQATASDRIKIYVNGEQVTAFDTASYPSLNLDTSINNNEAGRPHGIGYIPGSGGDYDGYLAEVNFIDGQALDPSYFGETDLVTNQWKPTKVIGMNYGTNGFYLPFSFTELANSFTDSTLYTVQSFTSVGTTSWTAPTGVTEVEYLVVAGGGGGGGGYYGGGGGAGGMKTGTLSVTPGNSYTVTVGAGGSGTSSSNTSGSDGEDSVFSTITSTGGGGGGGRTLAGRDGGSGGGGGGGTSGNPAGGSASPAGQGNDGGDGLDLRSGGGGGGAGAAGANGTNAGGAGGNGLQSSITGVATYYAGGGGGGSYNQNGGAGGLGGGGTGNFNNPADSGTANTGGGGGGASVGGNPSGDGGSGVVIVRYINATSGTVSRHSLTANGDVKLVRGTNLGSTYTHIDAYTSIGSDTWTCPSGVTSVEVLVVGGGGSGGGRYYAGGGGAGGVVHATNYAVTPGVEYDITVGAGGSSSSSGNNGNNGSDSVFNINAEGSGITLTATGGGGGGYGNASNSGDGLDGGSGGGGAMYATSRVGGSTTQNTYSGTANVTGYGNDGGDGYDTSNNYTAGGGGGAGAAGSSSSSSGAGGIGRQFTTFQAYGTDLSNSKGSGDGIGSGKGYFGGGGGGAGYTYPPQAGGAGGGGTSARGDTSVQPTAGLANTGGGGGGASHTTTASGAAGGSGIVLIAYNKSKPGNAIKFDGTGDYLSVADSDDWDFSSSAGTLEAWIKFDSFGSSNSVDTIFSQNFANSGSNGWAIYVYNNSGGGGNIGKIGVGTSGVSELNSGSYRLLTGIWYHLAVTRTSGGTTKIWVDGVEKGSGTGNYFTNSSSALDINRAFSNSDDFIGHMDEIRISNTDRYTSNFTPSTTEFTADNDTKLLIHTGDWSGGLGSDRSGNTNDYEVYNLIATDQLLDSPTNNFATLNPLFKSDYYTHTFNEGNLRWHSTDNSGVNATFGMSSGKWYWEVYLEANNSNTTYFGVIDSKDTWFGAGDTWTIISSNTVSAGSTNTWIAKDNATVQSGLDNIAIGDIVGIAYDADNLEITFYRNGSQIGVTQSVTDPPSGFYIPTLANGNTLGVKTARINFGQDSSFAGIKTAQNNTDANGIGDFYYAPPSGYLALCENNLPDPSIALPGEHFNTVLYTGNGSTQSITGLEFSPDLVWIKNRDATVNHQLHDSVRGASVGLNSNNTNAEYTDANAVTSFDSSGWSMNNNYNSHNQSSVSYVGWAWDAGTSTASNTDGTITSTVSANTTAGFSIVSYTGNTATDTNYTVGHGLSQTPDLLIIKNRDWASSVSAWQTWHTSIGNNTLALDTTNATNSFDFTKFLNQQPNSTVFTVRADTGVTTGNRYRTNGQVNNYIAYCFHSVEGYSKFGSYTGNNNVDGPFVYTGFKPAMIIAKSTASTPATYDWNILDSARNPYNYVGCRLRPNKSNADEINVYPVVDFLSNGFKFRHQDNVWNANGITYIYMAFAESPFKYSNAR